MALDFPTNPTNGQVFGNFYYDSSITAWRNLGSKNALTTAITNVDNRIGMVPIVPTSVTPTGGTATVNSITGTITMGAGMTGITVNGVFTSTYKKYMVVVDVLKNAVASNSSITAQLSSGGTAVTTGYTTANIGIASSNIALQNLGTSNGFYITRTYQASRSSYGHIILVNPQLAAPTLCSGIGYGTTLGDDQGIISTGTLTNNNSYTDLRFITLSDSFSGTVNIYGFRD
jgi:hypothetical protein